MTLNQIKKILGLRKAVISLENKIFNLVSFLVFIAMLISLASNIILERNNLLLGLILCLAIISFYVFYISRYKEKFVPVGVIYIIFSLVFFIPIWFSNGGIEGTTKTAYITSVVAAIMILPKRFHVLFIAIAILIIVGLYLLELSHPEWLAPYPSKDIMKIDVLISTTLYLLIIAINVSLYKRTYDMVRDNLIKKSIDLEESRQYLSETKQQAEEATEKILHSERNKVPFIIAMSANAIKEAEAEYRELGMKDIVTKPFTIEQLRKVLEKWAI